MRPYYRDEHYEQGRPQFQFSLGGNLWPPALKYTIIVTVICYLLQLLLERETGTSSVVNALALLPSLVAKGQVWIPSHPSTAVGVPVADGSVDASHSIVTSSPAGASTNEGDVVSTIVMTCT